MYLYDPRVNSFVNTDNPAIILADAMIRIGAVVPDNNFWDKIKILANYAEAGNGMGKIVKAEFKKYNKSLKLKLDEQKKKNTLRSKIPKVKKT